MTIFPFWFAVEQGQFIKYADLPHLMAEAMHPTGSELMLYGAARYNLERELAERVRNGTLIVRNRAGLGLLENAIGNTLLQGVMFPHEISGLLNERGIELRITPYGSGPEFWTLDNAALEISRQEGWQGDERALLLDEMTDAATHGALVVRHPHPDLPANKGAVRTYYEITTPDQINRWLESTHSAFRWNLEVTTVAEAIPSKPLVTGITKQQALIAFSNKKNEATFATAMENGRKWIEPARLSRGQRGRGGAPSMWHPIYLAVALREQNHVTLGQLDRAFVSHSFLSEWREDWAEQSIQLGL